MARTTSLTKRSLIGKANSAMVIAAVVATFVAAFTIVAGRSLISQMAYQNRVIGAKKDALNQLRADLDAVDSLEQSYANFVRKNPNVLAGNPEGSAAQDGDNAKIILDALPSKYDFPALTTSLEKLITDQNLQIVGISGTDDEVTQQAQQTSADPQPIAIPFQVQVSGAYGSIRSLTDVFLRSIRPFQIQSMELSGDEGSMTASIKAQTYYQPEKSLNIKTEVVQ